MGTFWEDPMPTFFLREEIQCGKMDTYCSVYGSELDILDIDVSELI